MITTKEFRDKETGDVLGCPVITCDRCAELITDTSRAVVVAPGARSSDGLAAGRLEFRHSSCFPRSERVPWRPLTAFLEQLANNTTPAFLRDMEEL